MAKQKGCELASILDQNEFDQAMESAYLQNGIGGDDAYTNNRYWIGLHRSLADLGSGNDGPEWKWTDGNELDSTDYNLDDPWKDHDDTDLYGLIEIDKCKQGGEEEEEGHRHCGVFDGQSLSDKNVIADGYLMKCCFERTSRPVGPTAPPVDPTVSPVYPIQDFIRSVRL
jgi:hypothetical protein